MTGVKAILLALSLGLFNGALSDQLPTCRFPDEYVHHPTDCNRFIHCLNGNPFVKQCPLDLVFSVVMKICVFRDSLYDDCSRRLTPRVSTTPVNPPSRLPTCAFSDEYIRHPADCSRFIHCLNGNPFVKQCPVDLVFSAVLNICVYKDSLYDDCSRRHGPSVSTTPVNPPSWLPTCRFPDEYIHDLTDCNRFIHCLNGSPHVKQCPVEHVFSAVMKICVFKGSLYDDCSRRHAPRASTTPVNPPSRLPTCAFSDEYIRHPADCSRFIHCANGRPFVKQCPVDLVFSAVLNICVYKDSLYDDCSRRQGPRVSTTPVAHSHSEEERVTPRITTAAGTAPPTKGQTTRVLGDLSASTSNARSTATCPRDSVVVNCFCSNEGTGCSGSLIVGRRCRVFNARGGPGQRAIGVCFQDNDANWEVAGSRVGRQPVAFCAQGFRVFACTMWNRMTHRERVTPTLDRERNSCRATSPCRFGRGCSVQAICRRT